MTTGTQDLLLNQKLENQSDELVCLAGQAVSEERMAKLRGSLRLGQFSNLLGVALETQSPLVVTNWLRYQMGRIDRATQPWRSSGLGEQVIKDIENVLAASALTIAKDVFGSDDKDYVRKVQIALTRRYIGYLRRWFVARGGQDGGA